MEPLEDKEMLIRSKPQTQAGQGLPNRESKFYPASILWESDFTDILVQNYYLAVVKHTKSPNGFHKTRNLPSFP